MVRSARVLVILVCATVAAACTPAFVSGPGVASSAADADRLLARPWSEYRSANFRVLSDGTDTQVRALITDLERFRPIARAVLGQPAISPEPLLVIAPRDQASFAVFVPSRTVAGLFLRGLRGDVLLVNLAARVAGLDGPRAGVRSVAQHEYVHAVIADLPGPPVPLWYNEGVAEYLSTARIDRSGAVIGAPIPGRVRNLLVGRRLGLDDLLSARPEAPDYGRSADGVDFHAHAWLLVHYLHSRPDAARVLDRYKALRRAGLDETAAIEDALGRSAAGVQGDLLAYVRGRDFQTRHVPIAVPRQIAITRTGDLSAADMLVQLARFQMTDRRAFRRSEAVLDRALAIDPDHVAALAALARLRIRQDRLDHALALADRALAIEPDAAGALMARAEALVQQADRLPSAERGPLLAAALGAARGAAAGRPHLVEPKLVVGLIYLHGDHGDTPELLREGLAAFGAARRLTPQNAEIAYLYGALLERAGAWQAAAVQYREAARWAHAPRTRELAARRLALAGRVPMDADDMPSMTDMVPAPPLSGRGADQPRP